MSGSYPFNQSTPPIAEARGDWPPPLPPRYSDGVLPSFHRPRMSEIVPRKRIPSEFEIPPWNNLNTGLHDHELGSMYPPGFNDTHRLLPSGRGIEIHEGPLSGRSEVEFRSGTSSEMKVCRQFQHRGNCAYGDQCRFLHEIPEKSRGFGSSSQNYEVRTAASDYDLGRRSGFDHLEEVRSQVQTRIVARSQIPRPVGYKRRPCYSWQTTGHCPYGDVCRFAHGEAEQQKLESSCSASEHRSVGGASATTSAIAEAGLRSRRGIGIGTDYKNTEPRIKHFFKSKELKQLIGIYGDWLED